MSKQAKPDLQPHINSVCKSLSDSEKSSKNFFLRGFVLMPFGEKEVKKNGESETLTYDHQLDVFLLLIFALNDAYRQNCFNKTVRTYEPIQLERADTGPGLSADLLANIFLKIDSCDFCVADLSTINPNVSLEIGYSLARNKHIVQLLQEDIFEKEASKTMKKMSDLSGKLVYPIKTKGIFKLPVWKKISGDMKARNFFHNAVDFFNDYKDKIFPFTGIMESNNYNTFLKAWIEESKISLTENEKNDLEEMLNEYEHNIVRHLYSTIRPLWEKIHSGGTEDEYTCDVFASRKEANFSSIFSSAKRSIKILTTNLEGLKKYIPDINTAIEANRDSDTKIKVRILTLDPESEFVNARGTLIGKEVAEFRKEMKDSLDEFKNSLTTELDGQDTDIFIRIYREFPTQITYIVDGDIYSNVVSVNHQSRQNIVFKIKKNRKGVQYSFLQHWDTIWARAHAVR